MVHAFCTYKMFAYAKWQRFSPKFSDKRFIILVFTFGPIIDFSLLGMVLNKSWNYFFHVHSQLFTTIFWNSIDLPWHIWGGGNLGSNLYVVLILDIFLFPWCIFLSYVKIILPCFVEIYSAHLNQLTEVSDFVLISQTVLAILNHLDP